MKKFRFFKKDTVIDIRRHGNTGRDKDNRQEETRRDQRKQGQKQEREKIKIHNDNNFVNAWIGKARTSF